MLEENYGKEYSVQKRLCEGTWRRPVLTIQSPELRQEGSQPLEDLQDSLRLKESNAFNNLTNTLYFRGYLEINMRK